MSICKWEPCINNARPKSPFCSGTCKKRYQRASGTLPSPSGTNVPVEAEVGQTTPCTQSPDAQEAAQGTKSDGPDVKQPDKCATEVEAYAKLDQPDVSLLPEGVSKPTGQRTAKTADMTAQQLRIRIRCYKGLDWLDSPEYTETIYRLLTWTLDSLTDARQFVPAWRLNKEQAA